PRDRLADAAAASRHERRPSLETLGHTHEPCLTRNDSGPPLRLRSGESGWFYARPTPVRHRPPMDPHSASITLCVAASAGALLVALSDSLRVPSIALLLVGGVLLGPEVLGLVQPDSLGRGLEVVVTLAIGIILFEGGLTLDIAGFRREP